MSSLQKVARGSGTRANPLGGEDKPKFGRMSEYWRFNAMSAPRAILMAENWVDGGNIFSYI